MFLLLQTIHHWGDKKESTVEIKGFMSNNIITARYTFIASTHKTLTKRDYILSHKKNLIFLKEYKRTEIIQSISSDHNEIKRETSNRNFQMLGN